MPLLQPFPSISIYFIPYYPFSSSSSIISHFFPFQLERHQVFCTFSSYSSTVDGFHITSLHSIIIHCNPFHPFRSIMKYLIPAGFQKCLQRRQQELHSSQNTCKIMLLSFFHNHQKEHHIHKGASQQS